MKEVLEQVADGHQFYYARSPEYASPAALPFRISAEPFYVNGEEAQTIRSIGQEISSFMAATIELYSINDEARELLDRGKPEFFQNGETPDYLFWRPDIIVTAKGFAVCEIETSVFGLALAELLNRGYISAGFETMVEAAELRKHVTINTPTEGAIVYTDKTKAFAGQLDFLAKRVFSEDERDWQSTHASEVASDISLYRAHYLTEYLSDNGVRALYEAPTVRERTLPGFTPQFEEKAILAFLWDSRFEEHYRKALGDAGLEFLRSVIPPTWIVGEEEHFVPGLPGNIQESVDLASLPRANRGFVLKPSGFSQDSSWSEGVSFLQTKSSSDAAKLLGQAASNSVRQLYVIQQFNEGVKRDMPYADTDGEVPMRARVRLTPYFSTAGRLLTIKATGREKTHFIHAATDSVNTAVGIK